MSGKIWVAVVVLIIVVGGFLVYSPSEENAENSTSGVDGDQVGQKLIDGIEERTTGSGDSKTFILTGENFKFIMNGNDNPDIIVNEGDTVRIEFTSTQGFHDWVVDEFNAATTQVRDTDGETFVEFVADKKGTFEYYCSVGQHRANGMKGNLIVQ